MPAWTSPEPDTPSPGPPPWKSQARPSGHATCLSMPPHSTTTPAVAASVATTGAGSAATAWRERCAVRASSSGLTVRTAGPAWCRRADGCRPTYAEAVASRTRARSRRGSMPASSSMRGLGVGEAWSDHQRVHVLGQPDHGVRSAGRQAAVGVAGQRLDKRLREGNRQGGGRRGRGGDRQLPGSRTQGGFGSESRGARGRGGASHDQKVPTRLLPVARHRQWPVPQHCGRDHRAAWAGVHDLASPVRWRRSRSWVTGAATSSIGVASPNRRRTNPSSTRS